MLVELGFSSSGEGCGGYTSADTRYVGRGFAAFNGVGGGDYCWIGRVVEDHAANDGGKSAFVFVFMHEFSKVFPS